MPCKYVRDIENEVQCNLHAHKGDCCYGEEKADKNLDTQNSFADCNVRVWMV
jgi:hypothetical protein